MKHNILPKRVPIQDIKVEVEKCVNRAVVQAAQEIYEDPPEATEEDKEAAFKACLNNVTNVKCNLTFRDNIKFALKTFIGKAKRVCSTRSVQAFHTTLRTLANDKDIKVCKFDKGVGLVVLNITRVLNIP